MQNKRRARTIGYLLILAGLLTSLFLNPYHPTTSTFWIITSISTLLWLTGGFCYILTTKHQRITTLQWILTIILLITTPLLFLIAETSRTIARYNHQPTTPYLVLEALAALLFLLSATFTIKKTLTKKHKQRR